MSEYLVNNPEATQFLDLARTEVGGKAYLGDAETAEAGAKPHILAAHMALRDAANTVAKLVNDKTRNDVQRHEAARTLANRTVETLTNQQKSLNERGEMLIREGQTLANEHFAKVNNDGQQASEIRSLIRDVAKTPDGAAKLREMIAESPRIAAVLYGSERVLMGLSPTLYMNLQAEAIRTHQPDALKLVEQGSAIADVAAGYDRAIKLVGKSFYNAGIASGAATRVEV